LMQEVIGAAYQTSQGLRACFTIRYRLLTPANAR
jgi:hypothetical protein